MSDARFALSAFGDEIADELNEQLDLLRQVDVRYLELRGVWGKNVLDLTQDEAQRVAAACETNQMRVSAIGSPIGKSPIGRPIEHELENLRRIADTANMVGTRLVRVFSFYPPEDRSASRSLDADLYVETTVERLSALVATASELDLVLLLENEKGIVGDTVERCHRILSAIDSPRLRFAWDPANFVQVGHVTPTADGWSKLGSYTAHVHVKDVIAGEGTITPAGGGSGQIAELLQNLRDSGYEGFLALEPHLAIAGHSSGFSGPDGMRTAVAALRELMAAHDCVEVKEITA